MLNQRVMTGLVLGPLALMAVFWLPVDYFTILVALIVMLGGREWASLAGIENNNLRWLYAAIIGWLCFLISIYSVSPMVVLSVAICWWCVAFFLIIRYPDSARWCASKVARLLMGFVTLIPAWLAMVVLKTVHGPFWIVVLLFLVWSTDVGAYFVGRSFGRCKLAGNVSPKKTIEGMLGGVVLSIFVAVFVCLFCDFSFVEGLEFIALAVLIALVSVLGDLLESLLKRVRGVKDSSNLLPGHGGILDRIDSLTAALPVFTLIIIANGG
ncbi:MAG: phosphatidate cytidylyltransferase [Candidatus Endonucleobacter bathymodioli]|uniref:Phosphatidate cytidylyltransferase n=1 Tax=Candidatus Endonucleibacter bathymodioli TaxID=539814 RepID=A0AA90NXN3_9GAMM|nr:phosphatidate cytidylyltransferase [Candidatus Endonucleobacter bathymodioli]